MYGNRICSFAAEIFCAKLALDIPTVSAASQMTGRSSPSIHTVHVPGAHADRLVPENLDDARSQLFLRTLSIPGRIFPDTHQGSTAWIKWPPSVTYAP